MQGKEGTKKTLYPESVSVYLPKGTKARLEAEAAERGMTVSTFLRIAVLDLLRNAKTAQKRSH